MFLFVIKHKQTIYSFQRLVKAFNTGAYSVENHLKHTQLNKTEFCQDFQTNNRLKSRNNRCFWFDSKSTNQNSFQPFQKHLRVTIGYFNKTTGCFSLSLKNTLILKDFKNTLALDSTKSRLHK